MVLLDALSYTGVCNMLFSGFMCDTKWCAASGADCEVRESVLAADDRVRCEDEPHIELQIASYIVIVMFAVGVPVTFLLLLVRKSRTVRDISDAQKEWLAKELESEYDLVESLARRVQVLLCFPFSTSSTDKHHRTDVDRTDHACVLHPVQVGNSYGFIVDAYKASALTTCVLPSSRYWSQLGLFEHR